MPVYEYLCPECSCEFELLRPISRVDEDVRCPQCQYVAKRIFSRFASFSKGSDGEATPVASTASSCSGCTSTSCSTCHL